MWGAFEERRGAVILIGIDEAGRGPVVGSMFVAAVALTSDSLEKLKALGLRDSKRLTPSQRAKLRKAIERLALAYEVVEVPVELINGGNLNELTVKAMSEALRKVIAEVGRVDLVIADVVGNGERQLAELSKVFDKVVVEKGADSKYLVVSAASVLAKEFREEHVRRLKLEYGDFGSGYPSDPKTKEWLKGNADSPIVRKRWKTVQRFLESSPTSPRGDKRAESWSASS